MGAQTAGEGRWADGEGEEKERRLASWGGERDGGWRKRRAGLFYVGMDLLFCGGMWEQNHSRDIRPGDAEVQCTVVLVGLFGFRCAPEPLFLFERNFGLEGSSVLARPGFREKFNSAPRSSNFGKSPH